ncbi:MAG: YbgC/FadM family acyl-CoA thioesterase [Pseudomonadota bacterium]
MSDPHIFPLTVYYEDTDMGGVVYYANYLRFIERPRSEVVEQLGMDQNAMKAAGLIFVVTRVVADYRAPARLGDRLEVHSTHYAKGVRWIFDQRVMRGDQVLFEAEVSAVLMTTEGKPVRLPAEIRAKMG